MSTDLVMGFLGGALAGMIFTLILVQLTAGIFHSKDK